MKHTAKTLALLSLSLVLGACGNTTSTPNTNGAQPIPAALRGATQETTKWFVELAGDPTSLGAQSLTAQQASFRAQALNSGIRYQELRSYHTLFNGFAVTATGAEISRISQLPGVLGVYPVDEVQRPDTQLSLDVGITPDMYYAKNMTGASVAQNELGLTGKGVKVAVIDSGMDVEHPAFVGRIVAGYDFVGDDFGKDGNYTPAPDPNPDDCGGHGTHVAGIIGGNDPANVKEGQGFKGVAPEVSFGAYRIFGCSGSSSGEVILAAMERAYADGMDVVNMSLGTAFSNWSEAPLAKAANRLVKKGVVVVASGGNSGADGQYSMGGPTMGEQVISVASVDNLKFELETFTVTPDGSKVGFYSATGAPAPTAGLALPLTKHPASTTATKTDGCTASGGFAPNSLSGKAVLIQRGTCSFYEKAINAQNAGAAAVVLYNNVPGYISPTVAGTPPVTIPVVSVSDADGKKLDALIAKNPTISFTGERAMVPNPTANASSSFSSIGMSADLEFKPDLGAPGGSIYSSYPLSAENPTGYAVMSGTSMASPHVAGAVALLLQAYPNTEAKDMRRMLMNTANTRWYLNAGALVQGLPDYVQRQGAGMLDITAAYTNAVKATPEKLSLGESDTFATRSKVVVLKNTGSRREVYTAYNFPALTISGTTLAPTPSQRTATMTVNGQDAAAGVQVVVPPFGEVELNVVVTPPAGATEKSQYGGYLYLESVTSPNLVVPYGGFKGDYQTLASFGNLIIGGKTYSAPLLSDNAANALYPKGATPTTPIDYTFKEVEVTYSDGSKKTVMDAPSVLVNFAHQIRTLTMEVLDGSGNVVSTLLTLDYVGRTCTNDLSKVTATCRAYSTLSWDGMLSDGKAAPNGTYQLRLKALKPQGDASNINHTEVYESQKFEVKR